MRADEQECCRHCLRASFSLLIFAPRILPFRHFSLITEAQNCQNQQRCPPALANCESGSRPRNGHAFRRTSIESKTYYSSIKLSRRAHFDADKFMKFINSINITAATRARRTETNRRPNDDEMKKNCWTKKAVRRIQKGGKRINK